MSNKILGRFDNMKKLTKSAMAKMQGVTVSQLDVMLIQTYLACNAEVRDNLIAAGYEIEIDGCYR